MFTLSVSCDITLDLVWPFLTDFHFYPVMTFSLGMTHGGNCVPKDNFEPFPKKDGAYWDSQFGR